ncbi:MAG TPA: hypothetical protein VGY54_23580, partial [Polyangiaceae bacterium]|nr:hypothetical protein [Polyangiaceae bacterium]
EIAAPARAHTTARSERVTPALLATLALATSVHAASLGRAVEQVLGDTRGAPVACGAAGFALGGWLGGRAARSKLNPLYLCGILALASAVFGGLASWKLPTSILSCLRLAPWISPGSPSFAVTRIGSEALAVLPAALLTGAIVPLLLAYRSRGIGRTSVAVSGLYMAATLGAGLGAILSGFVIVAALGIHGTELLVVCTNLLVGLAFLSLSRREPRATEPPVHPDVRPESADSKRPATTAMDFVVLSAVGLALGAQKTIYGHLLEIVVGSSAYTLSTIVFAFLVSLSLGAWAAARIGGQRVVPYSLVGWAAVGFAIVLLTQAFLWEEIPAYFASFAGYPFGQSFGEREFARLCVVLVMSLPGALCLGALSVGALSGVLGCGSDEARDRLGPAVATLAVGAASGELAASVLIGRFGSLHAIQWEAALAMALAALVALCEFRAARAAGSRAFAALVAGVGVGFLIQPRKLSPESLSSGAGYYFAASPWGQVSDAKESSDGLLALARREDEGRPVSALLLNGMLYSSGDVRSRYKAAIYPMIHTRGRTRALVIGYGTGALAHAFEVAGFDHVDIAEASANTIAFANAHFGSSIDTAFVRPSAEVHICSGRAMVSLSLETYDVISVAGRNMSLRGESMLHDREFYMLARSRLAVGGVLQDSVDLGRMDFDNLVSWIATLRSAFDHITLYAEGTRGVVVACPQSCAAGPDAFAELKLQPETSQILGDSALEEFLRNRLLGPASIGRLLGNLADRGIRGEALVSNDDNMSLEFSMPRTVVLNEGDSLNTVKRLLLSISTVPPSLHPERPQLQ